MSTKQPHQFEGRKDTPIRVLFVNDHLGYPGGVVHGGTSYITTVLPRFDPSRVDARLCILRGHHPAAEKLEAFGTSPLFLDRAKWDPRPLADLASLIRRWSIDMVHLNGMKAHLLGRLAARRTRTPAIIHLHFEYTPRPRLLHAPLGRGTAAAIAVSDRLRAHAIHAFGVPEERAVRIYNGLDLRRFSTPTENARARIRGAFGIGPDAPVVAILGRVVVRPDKGHRHLIRAMESVVHSLPGAILLVVGDGAALPTCKTLAHSLGLSRSVLFAGQREDIPDLLAAVDLVAVPSIVEEALSLSVIEALCAGRPVVGFHVGGLPELVHNGETGILVPKGDVPALADALVRLLGDDELRSRLGRSAAVFARRFEIGAHVSRLTDLYEEVREKGAIHATGPAPKGGK